MRVRELIIEIFKVENGFQAVLFKRKKLEGLNRLFALIFYAHYEKKEYVSESKEKLKELLSKVIDDYYRKPLGITIKADGSHPEHIEVFFDEG